MLGNPAGAKVGRVDVLCQLFTAEARVPGEELPRILSLAAKLRNSGPYLPKRRKTTRALANFPLDRGVLVSGRVLIFFPTNKPISGMATGAANMNQGPIWRTRSIFRTTPSVQAFSS